MPYNKYQNDDLQVLITYLPENFIVQSVSGTQDEGKLEFKSREILDELYGPYISFEYSWKKIPFDLREADGNLFNEVERQQQRINSNIIDRQGEYINSHLNQFLIGGRTLIKKEKRYPINEINGVFYCEHTERLVHYEFVIVNDIYSQWKETLIQIIHSVKFHY